MAYLYLKAELLQIKRLYNMGIITVEQLRANTARLLLEIELCEVAA